MDNTSFQLNQVLRRLGMIPDRIQKRVMTGSVRAGASALRDRIKDNVPEDEGNLKKQVKIKKLRSRNRTQTTFRIGLTREGYYGFFVHQGTEFIRPVPFVTKGYEQGGDQALERMKSYMRIRTEREISRLRGL